MDRSAPYAIRGMINVLSSLSLREVHSAASGIARMMAQTNGGMIRRARRNLEPCLPYIGDFDLETLVHHSVREWLKFGGEVGMVSNWPVTKWLPLIRTISGLDLIAEAHGRPLLVLIPHFGNWEILNLYFGLTTDPTVLYRPPDSIHLDKMIRQMRQRTGAKHVPTTASGLRSFLRSAHNNEIIALLPDQVPSPEAALVIPFFGRSALTMTFAHRLIQSVKPLVIFGTARRLPDAQGFDIELTRAPDGLYSADAQTTLLAMNATIEDIVRSDPAQYQWVYNRFKFVARKMD
jgi:KDO2-lipid IV(A) lauroyltransferase